MNSATARNIILVVDDEPLARMGLGEMIRELGFVVREAGSSADALAILEAEHEWIAGMVTDITMPGTRSGVVLANHVRWLWPHIAIVVVSGAREPMCGELPPRVEFLTKPVPRTSLLAAILKEPDVTAGPY